MDSRARRRLFTILAPLLALAALDLGLSAFLAVTGGKFAGTDVPPYDLTFTEVQSARREDPYFRFDPDLGWSIRPNGASEDGLFHANAAGFRAQREYALDPPSGVTRIAAFGDSFTHGDKVKDEDAWASRLERSAPGVEVLNFGVNAYGTDQAWLRYRRDGARYHPDIVLIGFLPENMLRNVSVYRPAYKHDSASAALKPRFLIDGRGELELLPLPVATVDELRACIADRSIVPELAAHDFWVRRARAAYEGSPWFCSSLARIAYSRFEQGGRARAPYYRDPSNELFRVTLEIVDGFAHEAIAQGARRAALLLLPGQDAIDVLLREDAPYWKSFTDSVSARGIEVIDPTPVLLGAARKEGVKNLFVAWHYDAESNALVAEAIAAELGLGAATAGVAAAAPDSMLAGASGTR